MAAVSGADDLLKVVTLLGAAVVMVPIFRKLGLGSVLGYLTAGLIIGPFGLKWFSDPTAIMHLAELGVVMFLFVIGLEMRPSHLWSLRREIFGLGSLQIIACTILLTLAGKFFGLTTAVAFICAMGFVLTSTAVVMQLLSEQGKLSLPQGQKMVSILLFEDLLIVPLLAFVAFMSPEISSEGNLWTSLGIGVGAIAGIIVAGVWLLNPLFRLLTLANAREVLTAATLLVVLGSALLMQVSGLSMAMGAFLAGVLLAESTFRHQIEADIEPFRGILLGLFFIGVGMSLNVDVVITNVWIIIAGVIAMMAIKAFAVYIIARFLKTNHRDALDRAILMAQGGEFAFVLFNAATAAQVIDGTVNANMTAIVVLSIALTPLVVMIYKKFYTEPSQSIDGVPEPNGLTGSVLMIGFGRFGQVASQLLLARNTDVTIIDSDIDMIKSAGRFGFKIYYGDGTRLDVLRASGAASASVIAVCIDGKDTANKIVTLVKAEFPQAKLLVRSYDRTHSLQLMKAEVDFQIRETFESAIQFGKAALCKIGVEKEEASEIAQDIIARDAERFRLELVGVDGLEAAKTAMIGNLPVAAATPVPFVTPQKAAKALNSDAAVATQETDG